VAARARGAAEDAAEGAGSDMDGDDSDDDDKEDDDDVEVVEVRDTAADGGDGGHADAAAGTSPASSDSALEELPPHVRTMTVKVHICSRPPLSARARLHAVLAVLTCGGTLCRIRTC
jgi:hypothetical protein